MKRIQETLGTVKKVCGAQWRRKRPSWKRVKKLLRSYKTIVIVMIVAPILVWLFWRWAGKGKTLWDLTELLIVPLTLLLLGYFISRTQREEDRKIAKEERDTDREIAREREEARMLQGYFDAMGELLIKEGLRESDENAEVRTVARARTLAVLREMGGKRKASVVRFLYESNLIEAQNPIVLLEQADLRQVNLNEAVLRDVNLSQANLHKAKLRGTDLSGANLSFADLSEAFLTNSGLSGADLNGANLFRAHLSEAILDRAYLEGARLYEARLLMAYLGGANLRGAHLEGMMDVADLSWARYDDKTLWPEGFDPEAAGAIKIEE